jgi:hypothetical protein
MKKNFLKEALLIRRSVLSKHADDEEGGSTDIPQAEVVQYFLENPNPDDETWHAYAESKGWNVPAAEAASYRLATLASHFVAKGKSSEKGVSEKDVNPDELAMGVEIEKEHTDDPEIAKRIALDHLAEIPDYYTRLKKMEEDAKKELGIEGEKEASFAPLRQHASLLLDKLRTP